MIKREHWIRTLPGGTPFNKLHKKDRLRNSIHSYSLPLLAAQFNGLILFKTQSHSHLWFMADHHLPTGAKMEMLSYNWSFLITKVFEQYNGWQRVWRPHWYLDVAESHEFAFTVLTATFPWCGNGQSSVKFRLWGEVNFKISVNFIGGQNSLFDVLWKLRDGFYYLGNRENLEKVLEMRHLRTR